MKQIKAVLFAITNRSFVVVALFLISLVLSVSGSSNSMHGGAAQPPVRPNILWIIADDLGTDLGCYGTSLVHTPNIDKLARQGARFTKAFTTAPVCSPSRSALITGMYQTAIGAQDHRMRSGDNITLPRDVKLLTDYFRQAGYFTANVTTPAPGIEVAGKTDFNFTAARPFDGTDWSQRRPGQPFYAQVNFFEPHRSTPGGYASQPVRQQKHPVDPAQVVLPPYYPDTPVVRRDWADYLNAVQLLDAKVGLVLDRLDREGLSANTIVMFFSDNGRPQVRGKVWLYDSGINVPLIVRYPGSLKPNTVREELVSGIDIAATSLDIAGIKLPQNMQGQIFIGTNAAHRKYVFAARDRCGEAIDRVRAVRTARYKYIRNFHPETPYTQPHNYIDTSYPTMGILRKLYAEGKLNPIQKLFMQSRKPVEEFYDTAVDPYEVNNLATSPTHQKVLKDLRVKLAQWMKQANDTVR